MLLEFDLCEFLSRYGMFKTQVELFVRHVGLDLLRREGPWLLGGNIRRTLTGESLRDFDIQGPSVESLAPVSSRLASLGFTCTLSNQLTECWSTERSDADWRVDISKAFQYPTLDETLAQFPFTICQFAVFADGQSIRLACTAYALPDTLNRVLMPVPTKDLTPERWFQRLKKYEASEYRVTSRTVEDMARILKEK